MKSPILSPVEPHSEREHHLLGASFAVGLLLLVLDQISKLWVIRFFRIGESRSVIPGIFSFTSVRNEGAAWSILSGQGWLLLLIAAVVGVGMVVFFRRLTEKFPERYIAFGMIFAGVIGNSIDRIWHGAVIDFLDVHYYQTWQYPIFNIADIAICTGVGLFILSNFLRPAGTKKTSEAVPEEKK